ncbi:hypothetical protein [Candidatus Cardinium sp. cBcalN1]|nr:hypothetical protein [Candidatus Cardinium sp. cBcalN1]
MNKKYTCARLSLFIGLFSLYTLSSCLPCLHRRESLGMHQQQRNGPFDQPERRVSDCLIKFVPMLIGIAWVTFFPLWIMFRQGRLSGMSATQTNTSMLNQTVASQPGQPFVNDSIILVQLYEWNQTLNSTQL